MRLFICTEKADELLLESLTDYLDGYRMTIDIDRIIDTRDSRPYLQSAIQDCDAFVLALTPNTLKSKRCEWEYAQAIYNKRPIVVAMLADINPFPESLEKHLFANLTQPEGVEQLLDALYVAGATPPSFLVQIFRNRLLLLIVVLFGVLLALVVAGPYSPFREQVSDTVLGIIQIADRTNPQRVIPTPINPQDDPDLRPIIAMTLSANAESLFLSGQERARNGDYVGAIDLFNRTLAIVPGAIGAHIARGRALQAIGERDTAWGDFTQAIELAPHLALPYISRAEFYIKAFEPDGALLDVESALAIEPDNAQAYNLRGRAHFMRGDFEMAIDAYNSALSLNDTYAEAYSNRGEAYRYNNRPKLAAADFEKAIALNSFFGEAFARRGELQYSEGNLESAQQDFTRAIEINPNNANARYGRALIYVSQSEYALAIADFTRAITQKPDDLNLYLLRGSAYRCHNEFGLAVADFTLAAQRNLDRTATYLSQVESYRCANTTPPNIDPNRIGVIDPNLSGVYQFVAGGLATRAREYAAENDIERASRDYLQAMAMTPSYTDVATLLYERGQMFEAQGNLNRALEDYAAAIEILPERSDFYVDYGQIMAVQGDTDEAFVRFAKALELNPSSIYAYLAQGDLYNQLEQKDRALTSYTRASIIDKDNVEVLSRRIRLLIETGDCKLADFDMEILQSSAPQDSLVLETAAIFASECSELQES